jgi:hypothetical protein
MTQPILALRVARRALAAAMLTEDKFTLLDGRHLSSQRERMTLAVRRYLKGLLERHEPVGVMILAPEERFDDAGILREVQTVLAQGGRSMRIVRLPQLLKAFGSPPLATREELWEATQGIFPKLQDVRSAARPFIVEAAALALYGETLLNVLPT